MGEQLFKRSLKIVAKDLDDKTSKEKILNIPLSQSAMTRSIEELSKDTTTLHKICAAMCSCFSLALVTSMNIYDTRGYPKFPSVQQL
jgi:hypothetical protein